MILRLLSSSSRVLVCHTACSLLHATSFISSSSAPLHLVALVSLRFLVLIHFSRIQSSGYNKSVIIIEFTHFPPSAPPLSSQCHHTISLWHPIPYLLLCPRMHIVECSNADYSGIFIQSFAPKTRRRNNSKMNTDTVLNPTVFKHL